MRKKININGTTVDLMMLMSEGNPGGLNVLMQLLEDKDKGYVYILDLDDMNIRGSQIWIGYKDHCGEDISKFKECLDSRDSVMVSIINDCPAGEPEEMAVTNGNSFK